MKKHDTKTTRLRRTVEDINDSILRAAKEEIIENGFENTTITDILKNANIQITVFHKRYNDLYDLFDRLIRPYDYWFEDNLKFEGSNPTEKTINTLFHLIDSLNNDPFMLQILLWEVSKDNYLTRRISAKRAQFFDYFIEKFFDKNITDISELNNISSFIVEGIIYFFLTRKRSNQLVSENDIIILKNQVQSIIISLSL